MDTNQMIILAIVILASIILVIGIYFLVSFLLNKKREKTDKVTFNPEALVEQAPLISVMEEKPRSIPNINNDKFVAPKESSKFLTDNYEPITRPSVPKAPPVASEINDPFHMKFEEKKDTQEKQDDTEIFMQ